MSESWPPGPYIVITYKLDSRICSTKHLSNIHSNDRLPCQHSYIVNRITILPCMFYSENHETTRNNLSTRWTALVEVAELRLNHSRMRITLILSKHSCYPGSCSSSLDSIGGYLAIISYKKKNTGKSNAHKYQSYLVVSIFTTKFNMSNS